VNAQLAAGSPPPSTPPTQRAFQIPSPLGATRLYGVIGDPITQVQVPALLNRVFAERLVDAVMVPFHARAGDISVVLAGLKCFANLDGLLVTVPHKFAVLDHLDRASLDVELAGSANAVRREADGTWSGENFDGQGFVAGLKQAGHDPRGKSVALIGTGGAGVAIAAALLGSGVSCLRLTDILPARADGLARRLDDRWPGVVQVHATTELDGVEIAINATPIGLRDTDPLPFELDDLPRDAVVADIIMQPQETRLLQVATQRGFRIHHGIHMLTEQIPLYSRFFRIPSGRSCNSKDAA
jgi:shikimate dehydrogenase